MKRSHVKRCLGNLIVWRSYNACNLNTLSCPPHTYVLGMCMKCKVQTPCILDLKQSPTLGVHTHAHGFWVGMGAVLLFMGGHGCDIIGHGWAWVPYYNGWAWIPYFCSCVSMGWNKAYWKGSLNELSLNAFEGKSTESPFTQYGESILQCVFFQ